MTEIFIEYVRFLRTRKKLWLLPLLAVMLLFGGVATLTQGSVAVPFVYALF